MKGNKWIGSLVMMLLSMSLIAGCTPKTEEITDKKDKAQSEVKTEDKKQEGGIASPSWKTDTSPLEVTWFVAYDWYGRTFNPETNVLDKWIQDETGCTIKFQAGSVDKLNALISTGNLPDIITYDANSSQRLMLENQGRLYPLNELRDKYAPDFLAPQSMIDWYTAPDGNWYAFTNYYYGDDNVAKNNGFFETHNENFVRKDILDKIGMELSDLRSKEGFIEALRKVKEEEIVYNEQKMIPYIAFFGDRADEQLAEQFGASMETKDGQYQSIYRTPEYLEAMLFFNQLYNEGLMTDESFTAKKDQIEQKVASGQLFATTRWTNVSNARNILFANDQEALMLYCGLMQGDNHDQIIVQGNNDAGWAATMINRQTEHPERIIQLFAFLSQDEMTLASMWGVDGYTMENGKVVRKPEFLKMAQEKPKEYDAKYGGIDWLGDYTVVQGTFPEAKTIFDEDSYTKTHDNQIMIYDDKPFSATVPEAGSEEAAIQSRVKEYMQGAVAKIVTAKTADDCRIEYETALTNLDNLGLGKLESYQNERFQENKKRLGLQFAHPSNR